MDEFSSSFEFKLSSFSENEHYHGNHSNRAMGFHSDDVRLFPSTYNSSKNIINVIFYGVYGYFSRGLVFLNRQKKMQCMRKSNEEMLMNAP